MSQGPILRQLQTGRQLSGRLGPRRSQIFFYHAIIIFPNDEGLLRCVHTTAVLRGAQGVPGDVWPLRLHRGDLRNAGDGGCSCQWGLRGVP